MYEIIKNVIVGKKYELANIIKKINTLWSESELTDDQRAELINLARKNAVPENSYASMQDQINVLFANVNKMTETLNTILEHLEKFGITLDPEEAENEYPEYVQPTGAHDAYHSGDKITYNGKRYKCILDGCVLAPDVYPDGWEEVE